MTGPLLRLFYEVEDGTFDYKMETMNTEQDKIREMFAGGGAAMTRRFDRILSGNNKR